MRNVLSACLVMVWLELNEDTCDILLELLSLFDSLIGSRHLF